MKEMRFNFAGLKKRVDYWEGIENAKMKRVYKNQAKRDERRKLWQEYKSKVWELTNSLDLTVLPNFEKRGKNGGYQLDHKLSIYRGWLNNTPIEIIGGINNLHFILEEENLRKGIRNLDEFMNTCKKCNG